MEIREKTTVPYGHHIFCKAHEAECQPMATAEPAALDEAAWRLVDGINRSVNRSIKPKSDAAVHGAIEVWSYASTYGDCEDYALHKRRRLIDAGFAPSNVLLTMVRLRSGVAHIVVTLRTTGGDVVLDSQRDDIRRWNDTGYQILKTQAPEHAAVWRSVGGGTNDRNSWLPTASLNRRAATP
ncbi:transglutaminase-like cysteine peptidase [Pararhizobium haloflavum]|uniref:transglutaminase-like cysteine peptidase n=1 Tax=Pararhizobium haloflavum TaxID=2037914 RepID=UPI0012FFFCC5|nr:transglutaminase-like cysteine peptidase [Pararhizobium haloflavum]